MKNSIVKIEKKKLPTIQELYKDNSEMLKQNKLNAILNSEPKPEWIKQHPFAKGLKYIPIERIEFLLTMIFSKWSVEIKSTQLIANSIVVTVRVHVQNPITGEMDYQDGIGAMPIQIKKGFGATQFEEMNHNAIQIGAPSAESYAVKDACEKFGKIFGKDINRKDSINYVDRIHANISAMEVLNNPTLTQEIRDEVLACKTVKELQAVWGKHKGLGKEFSDLCVMQKKEIKLTEKAVKENKEKNQMLDDMREAWEKGENLTKTKKNENAVS